jgi:glycosyltransferase involved in cell wall biosynthesis
MRVSVIIPCYNAGKYLAETLRSVLDQTHPVADVIVVDDGSLDDSVATARAFGSPVRIIVQANAGASAARNRALDATDADMVAFVDADDLWHPEKIERQLAYLAANPDVGSVASSFTVFGLAADERTVEASDLALRKLAALDFLTSPRIHPSSIVARGDVARSVRFPVGITGSEDVIYAALLRTRAPIGAVEDTLVRRREHPSQETRTSDHFRRALAGRLTWGQANCELLSAPAEAVRAALLDGAVHDVLARYWMRDLQMFDTMRRDLLAIWPSDRPQPRSLSRALAPAALLRLKDSFDRFVASR